MKTRLLTTCMALCFGLLSTFSFAQEPFAVLLVEDFEATSAPADWTEQSDQTFPTGISSTVPSTGWQYGETSYSSVNWEVPTWDGGFAINNDDPVDENRLEDILVSPVLDLSDFDSAVFLFDRFFDGEWDSEAYFLISYDAGANWLNLPIDADAAWVEDGALLPATVTVDGTDYTFNDQMVIGFLHSDAGGWAAGLAIDNVIIAGYNTPCDDVIDIAACDAPETVTLGGPGVNDWFFTGPCGWETGGQEQLFTFTPTVSGVHSIDVSSSTETSFLDYMYKPVAAGCDTLGWSCVADVQLAGEYGGMDLTAGVEYYILVDNEFIDEVTQTFSIKCPCTYTSLNGTPEGETCGGTDNDGCALDPAPPTYGSISCGETVSGTTFAENGTRDLDYYEIVLESDVDLEFTLGGGLPLNVLLVDNCTDFNVLANAGVGSCTPSTLTYSATAGTYYLLVAPTGFNGYACGSSEAIYDLSMNCACPGNPDAGTLTADATPVCLDAGSADISASEAAAPTVPAGYQVLYVLTEGAGLVIVDAGATPDFTVTAEGDYTIHTLVYDPNTLDPTSLPPGTTGLDVNELLVQGGGSICGALDVTGAPITVEECSGLEPCLTSANTWIDLNNAGGAPCNDGNGCTPTDGGFTTFGIYGSETYLLDNVQAGFDYVFDMCSGPGAGAWIPEITIVAPDGTTVDAWNGEAATGSSLTFNDNCSLAWTASQSGTYRIVINELGTAAGDAPNQVDCSTSYEVDNGSPTVSCGVNEATCLPCEAGTLTSPAVQDVCPGETFDVALSGNSSPGSYSLFFDNSTTGGTGGTEAPVTITGYPEGDFPLSIDEDINGVLSFNSLPPLAGTWEVKVIVVDNNEEDCDSTDSFTVNFLEASDPSCITVGVNEAQAFEAKVYPNPSNGQFAVEVSGVEADAQLIITDLSGRQIHSEGVVLNGNFRKELSIDAAAGTYLLQVITEEGQMTRRIQLH